MPVGTGSIQRAAKVASGTQETKKAEAVKTETAKAPAAKKPAQTKAPAAKKPVAPKGNYVAYGVGEQLPMYLM